MMFAFDEYYFNKIFAFCRTNESKSKEKLSLVSLIQCIENHSSVPFEQRQNEIN